MTDWTPILACSGLKLEFTWWQTALILFVVGGWLVSMALALVNPFLVCFLDIRMSSKLAHLFIWAIYVVAGLTVRLVGLNGMQSEAWLIPLFGVPILAISHFIALLWTRRWIRLRKQTASEGL